MCSPHGEGRRAAGLSYLLLAGFILGCGRVGFERLTLTLDDDSSDAGFAGSETSGVALATSSAGAPPDPAQSAGMGGSASTDGGQGASGGSTPETSEGASDAGLIQSPASDAGTTALAGGTETASDAGDNETASDAGDSPSAEGCTWSSFDEPQMLTGFGLAGSLWGPTLSSDGLALFFSHDSGTDEDLYVATRSDRGTTFNQAIPVDELNSTALESSPWLSDDGLAMFFASERSGTVGGRDLMVAMRTAPTLPFEPPTFLSELNTSANEHTPSLTSDLLTITYASNEDLWIAARSTPSGAFESITALDALNSPSSEAGASLSEDGLAIYFASQNPDGVGTWDIWLANRPDRLSPFSAPINVTELNTADAEYDPRLSADGTELFFGSSRAGNRDLWRASRQCL